MFRLVSSACFSSHFHLIRMLTASAKEVRVKKENDVDEEERKMTLAQAEEELKQKPVETESVALTTESVALTTESVALTVVDDVITEIRADVSSDQREGEEKGRKCEGVQHEAESSSAQIERESESESESSGVRRTERMFRTLSIETDINVAPVNWLRGDDGQMGE